MWLETSTEFKPLILSSYWRGLQFLLRINQLNKILIRVNAGNDPAKFGVSMESAESLVEKALALESIELEGLMTIAPLA